MRKKITYTIDWSFSESPTDEEAVEILKNEILNNFNDKSCEVEWVPTKYRSQLNEGSGDSLTTFKVSYYHLSSGMEGIADKRDYGYVRAETPELAREYVAKITSPDHVDWVMGCLKAEPLKYSFSPKVHEVELDYENELSKIEYNDYDEGRDILSNNALKFIKEEHGDNWKVRNYEVNEMEDGTFKMKVFIRQSDPEFLTE